MAIGRRFADVAGVFAIGMACLAGMLLALPYLEESRGETRAQMAYHVVLSLNTAPTESDRDDLPEKDPWGQPYRIVSMDGGGRRALSTGPNGVTHPAAPDADDIYSDMPFSPRDALRAKQRQVLITVAVAILAWGVLGLLWIRRRAARHLRSVGARQPNEN
jgi:hypothetical protein